MNILKTKPKHHLEIGNGAFIADFYVDEKNPDVEHNYLHIYAPNGVFEQKVVGYPYGYLLAAVSQGDENEIHSYCIMLWRITQEIYQDLGFAQDIIKAINKRDKRLMKQAEKEAAKVSEAEEMASDALMREAIERGKPMSRQQRRKMERESRKEMKQILNENSNGE
ncbi:hypothetical protein [uncultured Muribaculum sp.]|uniref:hypothetical protein n=1 Tax=uncultured Muribaculum sp. TaxID=1918613 RepID=UPI0027304495|nr:hypothetical protein [uncultured Muribaculum sp.]